MFSTQDRAAAPVVRDGSGAIFAWKGESLEEYCDCAYNTLTWPDDNVKGSVPDLIVNDGAELVKWVHLGYRAEMKFIEDKMIPDPNYAESLELEVILKIIARELLQNPKKWTQIIERCYGLSEVTTSGVFRLNRTSKVSNLLFPTISVNDSVTKSKFDNLYEYGHSVVDGLCRATDVMIAGKQAKIFGYGDVSKGCTQAMKECGAAVFVTETDPICALQI